jgi:hypothetical protein
MEGSDASDAIALVRYFVAAPDAVLWSRVPALIEAVDKLEIHRQYLGYCIERILANGLDLSIPCRKALAATKSKRKHHRLEYFLAAMAWRSYVRATILCRPCTTEFVQHLLHLHATTSDASLLAEKRGAYFSVATGIVGPKLYSSSAPRSDAEKNEDIVVANQRFVQLEQATVQWRRRGRPVTDTPKDLGEELQSVNLNSACGVLQPYLRSIETDMDLVRTAFGPSATKSGPIAAIRSARTASMPAASPLAPARPAVVDQPAPIATSSRVLVEDMPLANTLKRKAESALTTTIPSAGDYRSQLPAPDVRSGLHIIRPAPPAEEQMASAKRRIRSASPAVVPAPFRNASPIPIRTTDAPPPPPQQATLATGHPSVRPQGTTMGAEPLSPAPSPPRSAVPLPMPASQAPPPSLALQAPTSSGEPTSSGTGMGSTQENSLEAISVPAQIIVGADGETAEQMRAQLAVDGVVSQILAPSSQETLDRAIAQAVAQSSQDAQDPRRQSPPDRKRTAQPRREVPTNRQLHSMVAYERPSGELLERLSRSASNVSQRPHERDTFILPDVEAEGAARPIAESFLPFLGGEDDIALDDDLKTSPPSRQLTTVPPEPVEYKSLHRDVLARHAWQPDEAALRRNAMTNAILSHEIARYEAPFEEFRLKLLAVGIDAPRPASVRPPGPEEYDFSDDAPPRLRHPSALRSPSMLPVKEAEGCASSCLPTKTCSADVQNRDYDEMIIDSALIPVPPVEDGIGEGGLSLEHHRSDNVDEVPATQHEYNIAQFRPMGASQYDPDDDSGSSTSDDDAQTRLTDALMAAPTSAQPRFSPPSGPSTQAIERPDGLPPPRQRVSARYFDLPFSSPEDAAAASSEAEVRRALTQTSLDRLGRQRSATADSLTPSERDGERTVATFLEEERAEARFYG